jgi:hypothetical protein
MAQPSPQQLVAERILRSPGCEVGIRKGWEEDCG